MQSYFTALIRYAEKYIPLTEEEQAMLPDFFTHKRIKRKGFLVTEGEIVAHTNFVVKGCLRSYRIDNNGVERINHFAIEDWWISDLHSFLTQTPATIFVEALEETDVLQLAKADQ